MSYTDSETLLHHKGVRPTAIRLLILDAIAAMQRPVSLLELEAKLGTVDRSTIFRTVTLFLAHDVLHGFEDGSGSLKYELCDGDDAHSVDDMHTHFFCEACHRTFCMKTTHVPQVALPEGFVQHSVNYVVKGLCADCRRRAERRGEDVG